MTNSQESISTSSAFCSSAMLLFHIHKDEGTGLTHRKATAVAPSPAEMHLFLKLIPHTHSSKSSGPDLSLALAL